MANPTVANEQLLELLLTLKKTTPQAAKGILNAQPAIAYALIALMVSMNAVNIEVFQKTLAEYGAAAAPPDPVPPQTVAPTPMPALPPHLQTQYRTGGSLPPTMPAIQPPMHTPTPPYGYGAHPPPTLPLNGHGHGHHTPPVQNNYGAAQGYGYGHHAAPPVQQQPALPEALANIPPEQKALIMRVLSMTPDQINILPPNERATYIQIAYQLENMG
ncbi:hypothetical protein CPB83DRAFT_883736 [Crepidotus variabilis]|uniref:Transcription termination and cleavage factor C-terminal domain-containing protein n=1 Tax=Crepidotus variabilis TaxID=179855 RepID=A0A9P6EFP0_9AGAR|nr:hypothetical protein CPB83DRAFT_883736 [Crepidotus variabilis]